MTRLTLLRSVRPHRLSGGLGVLLLGIGFGLITQSVHPPGNFSPPKDSASDSRAVQQRGNPLPGSGQAPNAPVPENMSDSPRAFAFATDPPLPEYVAADLTQGLNRGETFQPLTINNTGAVLGNVAPPAEPGPPSREKRRRAVRSQAAVWENGVLNRLPIPAGAHRVIAGDINDRGTIAAISVKYRHARPPYTRILLYDGKSRRAKDIGTLDPRFADAETRDPDRMRGVSDGLLCLNNRGTLAALVGLQAMVRIGTDGSIHSLGASMIFDLNNNDMGAGYNSDVVGYAAVWPSVSQSSIKALLPATSEIGVSKDGRPLGLQGSAECINDRGMTVVMVTVEAPSGGRRIGRTAYYLHDGKSLHLIALLRGQQRSHSRINNAGEVVGIGDFDLPTQVMSPLLYRDGRLYDLTHIAERAGWTVVSAVAINDRHQILGFGYPNSVGDPFGHIVPILLTPR